jgi:hypothetical protein
MKSYTVFKFTERATENRSTCHAWHACRRLPTPGLYDQISWSWRSTALKKSTNNLQGLHRSDQNYKLHGPPSEGGHWHPAAQQGYGMSLYLANKREP